MQKRLPRLAILALSIAATDAFAHTTATSPSPDYRNRNTRAAADAAELMYPIILAADGAVMGGRHRVAKALREGRSSIDAVQFLEDPPPDYVACRPDELPY